MGSALLDTTMETGPDEGAGKTAATAPTAEALRLQVAERLAAHRSRRALGRPAEVLRTVLDASREEHTTRVARIAATVAERYAHSQSYRAFLAAEAERAVQQARAAAEVAAQNAQAVVAAQQRLLDAFDESVSAAAANEEERHELEGAAELVASEVEAEQSQEMSLWPEVEAQAAPRKVSAESRAFHPNRGTAKRTAAPAPSAAAVADVSSRMAFAPNPGHTQRGEFTVRPYEDAASKARAPLGAVYTGGTARANRTVERTDAEARALDEEIAFRQAPVFEEPAGPPISLPANLLEFPRQLVASRKARPRYAEGPLRDEMGADAEDGQLRIFEVDQAQISTEPDAPFTAEANELPAAQWTSIWLDTPDAATRRVAGANGADAQSDDEVAESVDVPLQQVATIGRRVAAAAIDAGIVFTGVGAFAGVFVEMTRNTIEWHAFGSMRAIVMQLAGKIPAEPGVQPSMLLGAVAVAGVFLYVLYQGLFFSLAHATPGMRCTRIALCTFDDENPTRGAMQRRLGAVLLSAIPLGLGFVWAMLDEDRLTWHDRISKMYSRSY